MPTVNEDKQKVIEAKVKKAIMSKLDQKGITSIGLLALCRKSVKELKAEHDYIIMNAVGRALTRLIKEGHARISYSDAVVLKFFSCK